MLVHTRLKNDTSALWRVGGEACDEKGLRCYCSQSILHGSKKTKHELEVLVIGIPR